MYGLEAINAANGWAMAIYGILIVLTGLWVLSTVIAQFPKAVALLEKHSEKRREKKALLKAGKAEGETASTALKHSLTDIIETARFYDPVVAQLGESFELKELYEACIKNDFPHPHLTIRGFREAGILVPKDDDGVYGWNR